MRTVSVGRYDKAAEVERAYPTRTDTEEASTVLRKLCVTSQHITWQSEHTGHNVIELQDSAGFRNFKMCIFSRFGLYLYEEVCISVLFSAQIRFL